MIAKRQAAGVGSPDDMIGKIKTLYPSGKACWDKTCYGKPTSLFMREALFERPPERLFISWTAITTGEENVAMKANGRSRWRSDGPARWTTHQK